MDKVEQGNLAEPGTWLEIDGRAVRLLRSGSVGVGNIGNEPILNIPNHSLSYRYKLLYWVRVLTGFALCEAVAIGTVVLTGRLTAWFFTMANQSTPESSLGHEILHNLAGLVSGAVCGAAILATVILVLMLFFDDFGERAAWSAMVSRIWRWLHLPTWHGIGTRIDTCIATCQLVLRDANDAQESLRQQAKAKESIWRKELDHLNLKLRRGSNDSVSPSVVATKEAELRIADALHTRTKEVRQVMQELCKAKRRERANALRRLVIATKDLRSEVIVVQLFTAEDTSMEKREEARNSLLSFSDVVLSGALRATRHEQLLRQELEKPQQAARARAREDAARAKNATQASALALVQQHYGATQRSWQQSFDSER